MTRWSLVVSDDTDKALRAFLALHGGKKGDISRFVEGAVRDRLMTHSRFNQTVQNLKKRHAEADQQHLWTSSTMQ